MLNPVFGTAHLFGLVAPDRSAELLRAAAAAGFHSFDTAPSYGFGESEPAVGNLISTADPRPLISTKVGIEAVARPSAKLAFAKAAARRLPAPIQAKLRGGAGAPAGHGQFAPVQVRSSIERSLARLGHIDRLLLHEVAPADLTDELLAILTGYRDRGDVAHLGVATANSLTRTCLDRAPDLFDVAHVAAGPLAEPVSLDGVAIRVGHGLFGNGGSELSAVSAALATDATMAESWRAVTADTAWAGPAGLANALLARGTGLDLTDVIVATSRPARLAELQTLLTGPTAGTEAMQDVLRTAISRARSTASAGR